MKWQHALLYLFLPMSLILFACDKDKDKCEDFEWSYEGDRGPNHWGMCFTECDGLTQSPLNIAGASADASLQMLNPQYQDVAINLFHNGHTIQFLYPAGSTLTLDGLVYALHEFHFHTESEHVISGDHYPMEVHLVHKHEPTGQLAVIGVFFEEGAENTFLKNFSGNLPANKDQFFTSSNPVNAEALMPADPSYYNYSGSLTTPPCSEIVTWFVMKTPLQASSVQLTEFHEKMHDNNRPVQELNGRIVKEY